MSESIAIDAARHDHPNRRLLCLHDTHLHRRGMRAQQPAVAEIERVMHRPRGMIRGNVQRFEVMPVVFDFRTIGDGETGIAENLFDAPTHASDRMQPAEGLASARQGDVDGFACQLQSRVFRLPATPRRSSSSCVSVSFASLIFAPASLRASGSIDAERFQQGGDLAFLAEQSNANVFERLQVDPLGNFSACGFDKTLQILEHGTRSAWWSSGWIDRVMQLERSAIAEEKSASGALFETRSR